MQNPVLPIVDPLGSSWNREQPEPNNFLWTADIVYMSSAEFKKLKEYSFSTPTGAYIGKMWKAYSKYDNAWHLGWYGPSEKLNHCSVNFKKLLHY